MSYDAGNVFARILRGDGQFERCGDEADFVAASFLRLDLEHLNLGLSTAHAT